MREDNCAFRGRVDAWLALPWTVVRTDEYGDPCLRVEELPGFLAAAETEAEVDAMFWPALDCFLMSYATDGEVPPLPAPHNGTTVVTITPTEP